MFSRFSFRTKMFALCVMLSSISIVVGGIGYWGLRGVSENYDFITDKSIPKVQLMNEMFLDYRLLRIQLLTLTLPGLPKASAQTALDNAALGVKKFEEAEEKYLALGFAPGQEEIYKKLDHAWEDFKALSAEVLSLYKSGRPEDFEKMAQISFATAPEKARAFTLAGEELLKFHDGVIEARVVAAKKDSEEANVSALIAILAGVAGGLSVGFVFAASIAKTMNQIIGQLSENSAQVSAASTQIAAASQELSQATTEQAASLQETAASIEELSSMVSKNSDNAKNTAATSAESEQKANQGKQVIEQMLTSMTEINESNSAIMVQVNSSNDQMAEIVKVIRDIGEKTKVINDIVFQTKLLSFNASVEAARAGEHGKGFAVVAEEVGNLAAMSGNAAKEISTMLDGSMQKVEAIVQETKSKVEVLIESGKKKVENGTEVAQQCATVLNEIVHNVTNVSQMAGEISAASREQSVGIHEITKAMGQLDQVTQQNAAVGQESASAAEQLSSQAEALNSVVEHLRTTMHGTGTAAAPVAHHVNSKRELPSNVTHLHPHPKKASKAVSATEHKEPRKASGDDLTPGADHPGFTDV